MDSPTFTERVLASRRRDSDVDTQSDIDMVRDDMEALRLLNSLHFRTARGDDDEPSRARPGTRDGQPGTLNELLTPGNAMPFRQSLPGPESEPEPEPSEPKPKTRKSLSQAGNRRRDRLCPWPLSSCNAVEFPRDWPVKVSVPESNLPIRDIETLPEEVCATLLRVIEGCWNNDRGLQSLDKILDNKHQDLASDTCVGSLIVARTKKVDFCFGKEYSCGSCAYVRDRACMVVVHTAPQHLLIKPMPPQLRNSNDPSEIGYWINVEERKIDPTWFTQP